MAVNKITKKQMFTQIMEAVADNEEFVAFIQHEIELIDKKSANKKSKGESEENVALKAKVLEVLSSFDEGATATEVLNADDAFKGLSNQKISSLLKALVTDGSVTKDTVKGKSIFSVA